ncbi:PPC domain-containing DNA-binding protein [Calderihabitans maritimus]|uniref:PPC domain-containing protein n=1 Tax=Calderihabitans maritimus TaxID=1246530 RepID=A0A1Z5HQA9_9FIRM|nr:PPC domain-containing DNA-binding protein [Calderihabitans maritimus]GAW91501.1 hypothetical protein Dole_2664 [Calderihabitans maritimus]
MRIFEGKTTRTYLGRMDHGSDLLKSLEEFIMREDIRCGKVQVIGAVSRGAFGFYSQKNKEYRICQLDKEMEIATCIGNISLKDGKPFVHAHILFSDEEGRTYGGHLTEGTIVFAAEFIVEEVEDTAPNRVFDSVTGLFLWE